MGTEAGAQPPDASTRWFMAASLLVDAMALQVVVGRFGLPAAALATTILSPGAIRLWVSIVC